MKEFNINSYMYIQIKDNGWEHLKKTVGDDYIKHAIKPRRVEINGEYWYKLQCYTVFELLPIKFGTATMFNTNVMFDSDSLKTTT